MCEKYVTEPEGGGGGRGGGRVLILSQSKSEADSVEVKKTPEPQEMYASEAQTHKRRSFAPLMRLRTLKNGESNNKTRVLANVRWPSGASKFELIKRNQTEQ